MVFQGQLTNAEGLQGRRAAPTRAKTLTHHAFDVSEFFLFLHLLRSAGATKMSFIALFVHPLSLLVQEGRRNSSFLHRVTALGAR